MPVNDADLGPAAERYAASLPEAFDLIHLGMGTTATRRRSSRRTRCSG